MGLDYRSVCEKYREQTFSLVAEINQKLKQRCLVRFGWEIRATCLTVLNKAVALYIPLEEPQTYAYVKLIQRSEGCKLSIVTPSKWQWPFNTILSVINVDAVGLNSLIHINGQDLKCGQWQAAILYKLCGDEAEACQVIDEGLEYNAY